MAQKMEISDFSVNKCKCFIISCRFLRKRLRSVIFSRDGGVTANIHFFLPSEDTALGSFFIALTEEQIDQNYDNNIKKVLNLN